jgi:hypothetical protein
MIARVRIAPVEQWCEELTDTLDLCPNLAKLVGEPVDLIAGKMGKTRCIVGGMEGDFKRFYATFESAERLHNLVGAHSGARGTGALCEHMLEMD